MLGSASLALTTEWPSLPPILRNSTISAPVPALPLSLSATEAHDGAFLAVVAV